MAEPVRLARTGCEHVVGVVGTVPSLHQDVDPKRAGKAYSRVLA